MRFVFFLLCFLLLAGVAYSQPATFIGSQACGECHEDQYTSFKTKSKKATSWHSVEVMASDLKPQEVKTCYECHTTGYGQPGGFVSLEATPHLADVGCETCHGPGGLHAETEDPDDLIRPTAESCDNCHNAERVGVFDFRALLYSGAH